MKTEYYIENSSLGFDSATKILGRRKAWIAVGMIIGLLVAVGYLLLAPKQYAASALVHVTTVSASSNPDSGVDMVTERELAASADTAQSAVEKLGPEWTRDQLMQGVDVTGDADGTVLRIGYTDSSEQRAVDGAMGIAEAYLEQRTSAALQRNESAASAIDEQIANQEQRLADLVGGEPRLSISEQIQEESLRQSISDLQQRKFETDAVIGASGQIITPADANPVYASPSLLRTLALGLIGGLALGIALALIVHGVSRKPGDSADIQSMLAVPAWRPAAGVGENARWALAGSFAEKATAGSAQTVVLADLSNADAEAAAKAIAADIGAGAENAQQQVNVCDLQENWVEAVRFAGHADAAIAVVPLGWKKATVERLSHDLTLVDANLVGCVVADAPADNSLT